MRCLSAYFEIDKLRTEVYTVSLFWADTTSYLSAQKRLTVYTSFLYENFFC